MKVVTPKEMQQMEAVAYSKGASEYDFMEAAGKGIAELADKLLDEKRKGKRILLLCGKGHNGGDAYVAGIYLKKKGYDVYSFQSVSIQQCKPLTQKNYARFAANHGICVEDYPNEIEFFASFDLLIDGLFGTGFQGIVEEPFYSLIQTVNVSHTPVLSIDIPSGLNGETGEIHGVAIQASHTAFLEFPKKGFFFKEGWNHVGRLHRIQFGLPENCGSSLHTSYMLLDGKEEWRPHLPRMIRNRHKYQAGYVVGIAGSSGLAGAAMLSSLASLRTGAGMVRLLFPAGLEAELSSCAYEVVKTPFHFKDSEAVLPYLSKADGAFIGPGLGRNPAVFSFLKDILKFINIPCVLDADALYAIAEKKWTIPKGAILTPHFQEMKRLLDVGDTVSYPADETFCILCQQFVEKHQVTLILKGGPTFIFQPNQPVAISPYGDPGMATAGAGDVLTGVIAAFLAQGLSAEYAAKLGVFFHGRAGEIAASFKTSYSMIASDLIEALPQVFSEMLACNSFYRCISDKS